MRKFCLTILSAALLTGLPVSSPGITFDGATTYQTIEGIGVNLNYRGWEGTNLLPVLNAFLNEAGISQVRLTFDLSDWEATNDNGDSSAFNWDYYNGIYSSPEFTRLWDMVEHLNRCGFTNNVCLTFMGWGPAWMMEADGRSLKAGMEDEWAEMVASALIYARNTRGLQLSLVTPNNEPDIPDEGIQILSPSQYTNTLHRLVNKLAAAGLNDLWLVGPDLSRGDSIAPYLTAMLANPTIMSRVKHVGVHSYSAGSEASTAISLLQGTAYADRSVWVSEFNVWCNTCDDGVIPTYPWSVPSRDGSVLDARGTAEYLLNHLQRGASAASVWEGYDSIYAHHYGNWGFFGVIGVDDINSPIKTYTPRKNFYTVAQISKWVGPGAQRIAVSQPNTWPFRYLTAFKDETRGQMSICGINEYASGTSTLSGTLVGLPDIQELSLYYTSATTNLAFLGTVPVNGGSFTASIPQDCVFTLTGNTARRLTNGVPVSSSHPGSGLLADYFQFTVPGTAQRAQFEVRSPSSDVTLLLRKDLPPTLADYHYRSANPGTNEEMIVLRPGAGSRPLTPGEWFLGVVNQTGSNVTYTVKATEWNVSGVPLMVNGISLTGNQVCLTWNALPGAAYRVQGTAASALSGWADVTGTLTATNTTGSFCLPLPNPNRFFRVIEGVAIQTP